MSVSTCLRMFQRVIFTSSLAWLISVASFAIAQDTTPAVTGRNVVSVERIKNNKLDGTYRQIDATTWLEQSAVSDGKAQWKELRRDATSVYLHNGSFAIQLDLAAKKIWASTDNFQTRVSFYDYGLANPKAAGAPKPRTPDTPNRPMPPVATVVTGQNLVSVERTKDNKLDGTYRQIDATTWLEQSAVSDGKAQWKELRRDATSVYLHNGSFAIQLDLQAKRVWASTDNFQTRVSFYDFGLANPKAADAPKPRTPDAPDTPGSPAATGVTGRNLIAVERHQDNRLDGYFFQVSGKAWLEESAVADGLAEWTELRRDETSVYLTNDDLSIQLDLAARKVFASEDNFQTRGQLYNYTLVNPVAAEEGGADFLQGVNGRTVVFVERHQNQVLDGYYRQTGPGTWLEESAVSDGKAQWTEVRRDPTSVYLTNGDLSIQLDLVARKVFVSSDDFRTRSQLYSYTLANPSATDVVTARLPKGLSGQTLAAVERHQNNVLDGYYRRTSDSTWLEESAISGGQVEWTELRRDDTSVYLTDGELSLQLDLAAKKVFVSDDNFQTRSQLYDYTLVNPTTDATAALARPEGPTGLNLFSVERFRDNKLDGYYRQTGEKSWLEQSATNNGKAPWTELRRDRTSVYLSNGSFAIQLDLEAGKVFASTDNFQTRQPFYDYSLSNPQAVSGFNLIAIDRYREQKLDGSYRLEGISTWIEQSAVSGDTAEWKEVKRDHKAVYLTNGTLTIQLDVLARQVFVSTDDFRTRGSLYDYTLGNAKIADTPATAPAGALKVEPLIPDAPDLPQVQLPAYAGPSRSEPPAQDKPVPPQQLPTAAAGPQLAQEIRQKSQTGTLNLGTLEAFRNSALSDISIEAPQIGADGSITGTTTFGGKQTPVLLQYVPEQGSLGNWVLAFKVDARKISDLAPSIGGSVADQFALGEVILAFTPKSVEVESGELSPAVRQFYGSVYGEESYDLELNQGLALLTAARPLGPIDFVMSKLGVSNPRVVLRGTLLKDYDTSALREARRSGKLGAEIKRGLELRATLPEIQIKGAPNWIKSRGTDLVVSGTPSVGVEFLLSLIEQDGTEHQIDFSVSVERQTAGSQISATGKLRHPDGVYRNAFGIRGLDLKQAVMTMNVDTQQNVGFGLGGDLIVGGRNLSLAGAFKVNLATGLPSDALFQGSIDMLKLEDMVALANVLGAASNAPTLSADGLPELYLKDVYVRFAPKDGNEALGIEQGFALKGELFAVGQRMAYVDATITTGEGSPTVAMRGEIHPINLDVIVLKQGKVDIHLGSNTNPHFKIDAAGRVLIKETAIKIDINSRTALCRFTDVLSGVYTAEFTNTASTVGKLEWKMEARFTNDLADALEKEVNAELERWAEETSSAFSKANRDVASEQARVREWEGKLATARREAQADLDRHLKKVRDAQAKVAAERKKLQPLKRAMDSARSDYRNNRNILKKAYYGTKWRGAQAAYEVASKSLVAAEKLVAEYQRQADKHGVEGNPEVIYAKGKVDTYRASLKVAQGVLDVSEGGAQGGIAAAKWLTSHPGKLLAVVREVRMKAALGTYTRGGEVSLSADLDVGGKRQTVTLEVNSDDIRKNRIPKMLFEEIKKIF